MSIYNTIFAIKRYALHDGPNLRTTVFFKGCPLNCLWCHNPEGIDSGIKIISASHKCVGCGDCVSACPSKALKLTPAGPQRLVERCEGCTQCVDACPALVHEATGTKMSLPTLLAEIEKDRIFFDQSGGGVTFSGGEPMAQLEGLLALLKECGHREIHRAVDTSGFAPQESFAAVAPHTDMFLYDLKVMDDDRHRLYTGVSNGLIHENLRFLSTTNVPIRIRIPLIANINDDPVNIKATGRLVASCRNIEGLDLLPFHSSAVAKYHKLGTANRGSNLQAPDKERLAQTIALLHDFIDDIRIGG
jgi:pyruvate formate lyase activating enzyme